MKSKAPELTTRGALERVVRSTTQRFSEQIAVHAAEVTELDAKWRHWRSNAAELFSLVKAARRGEWTPADDVTFVRIGKELNWPGA